MSDHEQRRLQRLAEELEESGFSSCSAEPLRAMVLEEVDRALRPAVHERRVPSSGTIIDPRTDPESWTVGTRLDIAHMPAGRQPLEALRRLADGLSSWLVRHADGGQEWLLFDRPAGSERDLTVLSRAMDATIVQRHPSGVVRVVGAFGVLRWQGLIWHHEPPVTSWLGRVITGDFAGDPAAMHALAEFAVHDLAAFGIGALLVYSPDAAVLAGLDERLTAPAPLDVRLPPHLAPLRHVLGQIDGAAVFDVRGVLRRLGVRLVPSPLAEAVVDGLGGTRHTSARRFSYDNPSATVVAVSEDGPVSVLRAGAVLGGFPDEP